MGWVDEWVGGWVRGLLKIVQQFWHSKRASPNPTCMAGRVRPPGAVTPLFSSLSATGKVPGRTAHCPLLIGYWPRRAILPHLCYTLAPERFSGTAW